MSTFGKILLVLNLIGAVALSIFAVKLYSKRQEGSRAYMAYELTTKGLPADEDQRDKQGVPVVERLPDSLKSHLFSGVGEPLSTQVEEVRRLKALVDKQLEPTKGKPVEGAYAMAELLIPFSDSTLENDQYLAARAHLAPKGAKDEVAPPEALLARYQRALESAKGILKREEDIAAVRKDARVRPADEAFRLAFAAEPGLPSAWVTNHIARGLPPKLAELNAIKDIKPSFDKALQDQLDLFEKRKEQLFADALVKPEEKRLTRDQQRAAIARLMFGLSQYPPLAKDKDEEARMIGRLLVVCGLEVGRGAITRRAETIRELARASESVTVEERAQFIRDLTAFQDDARALSTLIRTEERNLSDVRGDILQQESNLTKKTADVEKAKAELAAARKKTKDALEELRGVSTGLLEDRVRARDRIDLMEVKEKRIRELSERINKLEAQINKLEAKPR